MASSRSKKRGCAGIPTSHQLRTNHSELITLLAIHEKLTTPQVWWSYVALREVGEVSIKYLLCSVLVTLSDWLPPCVYSGLRLGDKTSVWSGKQLEDRHEKFSGPLGEFRHGDKKGVGTSSEQTHHAAANRGWKWHGHNKWCSVNHSSGRAHCHRSGRN